MTALAAIIGTLLIFSMLWEAFETIILPRRVTRSFRLTRAFYIYSWRLCRKTARHIRNSRRRQTFLSAFGPLSLLGLLIVWAAALVVGFAAVQWAAGSQVSAPENVHSFWTDLYMSGTTFFTLGLGDVTPRSPVARFLTVIESGMGFGFLAIVIGYLPTIYGAFSRREANITLLDARAGSPPSATELLRRHAPDHEIDSLNKLLRDWEGWAADLLESHLSYPVLCYYRSQHDNQSWLSALTCILDTCALVMVGIDGIPQRQAQLTFAIARHAVVDLSQIFRSAPKQPLQDRLPAEELRELRRSLIEARLELQDGAEAAERLRELRGLYEPYVFALSEYLLMTLPTWIPLKEHRDNWQTSAWGRISGGIANPSRLEAPKDEHF
jgi:ABC-type multidrug transport system fused ATPase/permease subunit